jgi:hypothetical protein
MNAILLFVGLWLMAASAALAQTAEEAAYVALRRQTVADLEAKRQAVPSLSESAWNREEARAHEAMMARLLQVVGAPPNGFSAARSNPDPLCCAPGAGSLDALVISNGRIRAVMTTEGLLRLWLGRDPLAALRGDAVDYYRALNADAPVEVFAPLPVAPPAGTDLALGRLVVKGQGAGRFPLHTVAAVVRKGRVLITMTPASLEAPDAGTTCEMLWQQSTERYREADELDERRRINLESGERLAHCVKGSEGQALFPGLGRRAQKLVDALSAE